MIKTHDYKKPFFDTLIQQGFKAFSLSDLEGNRLITYNTTKIKPENKVKEIIQRMAIAPDGVYKLQAQFGYSQRTKPETYYLKKGNVDTSFLNEQPLQPPVQISNNRPNKNEQKEQNVLSLDSALSRIEELSKLRAENEVLKERCKQLEIQNAELNAELDAEPENLQENSQDKIGNWLENIMPTLSPLADEYFKLQNRKLQLDEYKTTNYFAKQNNQQQRRKVVVKQQQEQNNYPDINNPDDLNGYFEELDKLGDEQFEQICNFIQTDYPELYLLIEQEFYPADENENEQTQN